MLGILFFQISCDTLETTDTENVEFVDISNSCLEKYGMGNVKNIVINTQEEYDSLMDEKYNSRIQTYLQDYLDYLKKYYPELSYNEQKEIADSLLLEDTLYEELTNCTFTEIDFNTKTLVGIFTQTLLCEDMEYFLDFTKNNGTKKYKVNVRVLSSIDCWELLKHKNFWLLIDKVPANYSIEINTRYMNK